MKKTVTGIIAAACVAAVAFIPTIASAQARSNCAPHEIVVDRLQSKYNESRRAVALSNNGSRVVEIYASEEGSWTIILVSPNQIACLVASGQSYEQVDEPLPEDADDT